MSKVHRATVIDEQGKPRAVAVKVQHLFLDERVDSDMTTIQILLSLMSYQFPGFEVNHFLFLSLFFDSLDIA